jgi:transcriptional regulator with XRE-family HTH domain
MPDHNGLKRLRELREMKRITQSEMAAFFSFSVPSARNRMSKWENGEETPPVKHRETFIRYLLERLDLKNDVQTFDELWTALCLIWRWSPLYPSERKRYFEQGESSFTRRIIYELPNEEAELRREVTTWPFKQEDRTTVEEHAIMLHGVNSGAGCRVPTKAITDFGVECKMKIQECGDDPWMGLIVRGFDSAFGNQRVSHIDFGYLVYLRANGLLELYCRGDSEVAVKKPIEDATKDWTKLKVEVIGARINVFANGEPYISKRDSTFGGKGHIYLQAHKSTACFKGLSVYEIIYD